LASAATPPPPTSTAGAAAAGGLGSTILTSPGGVLGQPQTGGKTLLGG
jgi:hypothetical protein